VRIRLVVDARGRLIDCRPESSSGSLILDGAALNLVKSIFPLRERTDAAFEGVVAIRYQLGP
jgi:TonB family protein